MSNKDLINNSSQQFFLLHLLVSQDMINGSMKQVRYKKAKQNKTKITMWLCFPFCGHKVALTSSLTVPATAAPQSPLSKQSRWHQQLINENLIYVYLRSNFFSPSFIPPTNPLWLNRSHFEHQVINHRGLGLKSLNGTHKIATLTAHLCWHGCVCVRWWWWVTASAHAAIFLNAHSWTISVFNSCSRRTQSRADGDMSG